MSKSTVLYALSISYSVASPLSKASLNVGQQVAGRLADDRDAAAYELQGDGGREVRFAGPVGSLYVEALAALCALWKAVCIGFGRVVASPPLRGVPDEVGKRPLLEAFLDAAPCRAASRFWRAVWPAPPLSRPPPFVWPPPRPPQPTSPLLGHRCISAGNGANIRTVRPITRASWYSFRPQNSHSTGSGISRWQL